MADSAVLDGADPCTQPTRSGSNVHARERDSTTLINDFPPWIFSHFHYPVNNSPVLHTGFLFSYTGTCFCDSLSLLPLTTVLALFYSQRDLVTRILHPASLRIALP